MTIERRTSPPGQAGEAGGSALSAWIWPDQRWLLVVAGLGALLLGALSSFEPALAIIALAIFITIIVGWWARLRGDTLVVAVALLVFWAPFHTSVSQFNLSPQEVTVYFVILACLMLDRRGIWGWLKAYFTSVPRVSQIAIGVFALACLQSVALESGVSALNRVQALRSTLVYPVLFALLVTYTVRSRRVERVLLKAFYGGALLLAAYALTLKLWGVDIGNGAVAGRLGAEASFLSQYHPNNIGLYLALALPFALPLWYEAAAARSYSKMKQVAIIASALLLTLDIMLAASRGTLVALAISVVVALFFLLLRGTSTQRAIVASVALGAIAGGAALVLGRQTAGFGRYALLFNPSALLANPNVAFRLQLYQRAYQLIKSHPFTGIGLQGFATTGAAPFSPHDTYLDLWVGVGIFGLLAFVFVLAHAIWSSFRWANHYAREKNQVGVFYSLGIIFALVAFMAQGFVEAYDAQPRIAPAIWMLALIAQAAVFTRMLPHDSKPDLPRPTPALARVSAPPQFVPPTHRATHRGDSPPQGEEWQAGLQTGRRSGGPRAQSPSAPPAMSAPPQPPQSSPQPLQPQWDWNLQTGPLPVIGHDPLPVFQDDPFQISSEFEAVLLQDEARAIKRAAATGELAPWSAIAPWVRQTEPPTLAPADPTATLVSPETSRAGFAGSVAAPNLEADALLKRAPSGYAWNQIYSMLIFGLNFVLSVVIARGLSAADFGLYSILSTIVSTLLLLFAFGLEDAASVFVPRLLTRGGRAEAATLIRRMLIMRTLVMVGIGALLAVGLPFVATPMQGVGLAPPGFARAVIGFAGLRAPLMGVYLAGSAIVALQGAFFASILKTRATLIIGGITQALGVLVTVALLYLGYGIDGIFAAQAVVSWIAVLAFLVVLRPYLFGRRERIGLEERPIRGLMVSAWLTNVSNGALGKQMDIMLMSLFAISYVAIGYYNLAYQLVSIVAVLLISGLGGVSIAAMSVAYTAHGPERLASLWRAIVTLHLALSAPLQVMAFILAGPIVTTLYGPAYAGAIPLLRIFLVFSFLGRMLGGGANQSALYVLDKQRIVLTTRWIGFAINLTLDIILIQVAGPAGALIATGFTQLWVNVVEFLALRRAIANHYPMGLALRVVAYSLFAAIPAMLLPVEGLLGLVARGALFVALFVVVALVFRMGDSHDIIELATLNPRVQWLITLAGRFSVRRALRSRQVV